MPRNAFITSHMTAMSPVGRRSSAVHQRQVRVRVERYLGHCWDVGIDPIHCSADQWSAYVAEMGWTPARVSKEASAVRAFLAAAGVLSHEHGLGTGNQSSRLPPLGSPDRELIERFLSITYPRRAPVARSALAKLATWADEMAIPLAAFEVFDVDDFQYWLRVAGGRREVLVVARKWARYLVGMAHEANPPV